MSGLLFSPSNLHDMTNSSTEPLEVGEQLPAWRVTKTVPVSMTVCTGVGRNGCTRNLLTQHRVNLRVLAKKNADKQNLR